MIRCRGCCTPGEQSPEDQAKAEVWLKANGFPNEPYNSRSFLATVFDASPLRSDRWGKEEMNKGFMLKVFGPVAFGGAIQIPKEVMEKGEGVVMNQRVMPGNFGTTYAANLYIFVKIENGGFEPLGVGIASRWDPKMLTDIAVLPPFQHKGIATKILEKAREDGVVWVAPPYTRAGFLLAKKFNRESLKRMPEYVRTALCNRQHKRHVKKSPPKEIDPSETDPRGGSYPWGVDSAQWNGSNGNER